MPKHDRASLGFQFAQRFEVARWELRQAPRVGARDLPNLLGLNSNGTANAPIENYYAVATQVLAATGKVYLYGENVMMETGAGETLGLQPLTMGRELATTAQAMLANHITCQSDGDVPRYFPPPHGFVATLLAREPTRDALPKISTYAKRPVYDENFVLCGPGYNAEQGILVHGPDIEPILPGEIDIAQPLLERLPRHLSVLLSGFCFREPADVANALAAILTGALGNHFVRRPKAIINVDANQAGVGKTLLALATGAVLDGQPPELIHYTAEDEELTKRVLANLRQRPTSVLTFDNAKNRGGVAISSPCIEANSMAPNITLRILGKSDNYTQPNDVLWFLTMNQTKVSPDLASRGMPIRLHHDGDPSKRIFDSPNPLEYAIEHRDEILGELFGLIEHWKSLGRPRGHRQHRCEYWAQVIGGILEACGFPEFLGNAAQAAAEFNTELEDLAALAERVVRNGLTAAYTRVAHPPSASVMNNERKQATCGLPAGEWRQIFRDAGVAAEQLEKAKSNRGRTTIIGNFLSRLIDREVGIQVDGRSGTGILRSVDGRSGKTLYYFEIVWDEEPPASKDQTPEDPAPKAGPQPAERATAARPTTTRFGPTPSRESPIDRRTVTGSTTTANDESW